MPDPRTPEFWELEDALLAEALLSLVQDALFAGVAGGMELLIPELAAMVDFDVLTDAVLKRVSSFKIEVLEPMNKTTRKAIQKDISDWITSGDSFDVFKKTFTKTLDDVVLSATRAEMIAVTEITRLFAEGNLTAWEAAGLVSGKQWMTAEDDLVCPICLPLDGMIVEIEAVFELLPADMNEELLRQATLGAGFTWQTPPAHPRCLTGDTLITASERIAAISKRWYEGNVVILRTSSENEITVTPNHPILTNRGWIAADLLSVGDKVVSHDRRKGRTTLINGDQIYKPTTVEEMADSPLFLSATLANHVPVTTEDFHGDGRGSEIATIWADSLLRDNAITPINQPLVKLLLQRRIVVPAQLLGLRSLNEHLYADLATSGSVMGGLSLGDTLFGGHVRPLESLGFGLSARLDATINQTLTDSPAVDPIYLGECVLGHTTNVFFDEIVNIQFNSIAGHVYNLQTATGAYAANGIITHNCRCWLHPFITEVDIERRILEVLV